MVAEVESGCAVWVNGADTDERFAAAAGTFKVEAADERGGGADWVRIKGWMFGSATEVEEAGGAVGVGGPEDMMKSAVGRMHKKDESGVC